MMKVVITGATGMVCKAVLIECIESGHDQFGVTSPRKQVS
jgi:nucleoside-diphosphate-sugar epimerase